MRGNRTSSVGLVGLILLVGAGLTAPADARTPSRLRITESSVGPVRIGMTVAQARRVLPGMTLRRTTTGDGVALISVEQRRKPVMALYAGEADPQSRINEQARIELIQAQDTRYSTAAGVHPGMRLSQVERRYGKVREIRMSEIEMDEFATFSRAPRGFTFEVGAANGFAGRYRSSSPGPGATTRAYVPSARLLSIHVRGRRRRGTAASAAW